MGRFLTHWRLFSSSWSGTRMSNFVAFAWKEGRCSCLSNWSIQKMSWRGTCDGGTRTGQCQITVGSKAIQNAVFAGGGFMGKMRFTSTCIRRMKSALFAKGQNQIVMYITGTTRKWKVGCSCHWVPCQEDIFSFTLLWIAGHFRTEHYLCEHPSCLEQKFVVFRSEQELKAHCAKEHSQDMSKAELKQARSLQVSFNVCVPTKMSICTKLYIISIF